MSANKANIQAVIVTQPFNPNQAIEEHAFFNASGSPITFVTTPTIGTVSPTYTATTADIITAVNKTFTVVEPAANTIVFVKYTAGNSVAHTLQFSGGVVRNIQLGGAAVTAAKHTVAANGVVGYWFDGTIFHMFGSM